MDGIRFVALNGGRLCTNSKAAAPALQLPGCLFLSPIRAARTSSVFHPYIVNFATAPLSYAEYGRARIGEGIVGTSLMSSLCTRWESKRRNASANPHANETVRDSTCRRLSWPLNVQHRSIAAITAQVRARDLANISARVVVREFCCEALLATDS